MQKTINIVYVTCFLDVSGVTRLNLGILRGLDERFRVHVATTEQAHLSQNDLADDFQGSFGAILRIGDYHRSGRLFAFVRYVLENEIHLIYATHSLWLYEQLAAVRQAVPSVRIVDSLHVLEPFCFRGGYPDISAHSLVHPYLDASIVISDDLKRYLVDNYSVLPEKLHVVHNGIDSSRFINNPDLRTSLREQLGIRQRVKVIGFIGRMTIQKRPLMFVDIACQLASVMDEVVFCMVGAGPLDKKVRDRIKRLGMESKVKLLGTREDIEGLLNSFDALVVPSSYEGAPLTILEAQSVGIPVVAADVGAVKEYVGNSCLLVPRSNASREVAAYCAALQGLLRGCEETVAAHITDISQTISGYQDVFAATLGSHIAGSS